MNKIPDSVAIFDKLAELYQTKYMDVSLYHDSLDLFCDRILVKNPEILEIACGPGNITKYLLQKRSDFKIYGIDLAPNMISLAKINNPTACFEVMDCRDIDKIKKKYTAIMCGFCLPYLNKDEVLKLIRDASDLLYPDGILYISTMEDDYEKSGKATSSSGDQMDMFYYTGDFLQDSLKDNGFEILSITRQEFPTNTDLKVTDLIIITRLL